MSANNSANFWKNLNKPSQSNNHPVVSDSSSDDEGNGLLIEENVSLEDKMWGVAWGLPTTEDGKLSSSGQFDLSDDDTVIEEGHAGNESAGELLSSWTDEGASTENGEWELAIGDWPSSSLSQSFPSSYTEATSVFDLITKPVNFFSKSHQEKALDQTPSEASSAHPII